jgi:hypothetical protein
MNLLGIAAVFAVGFYVAMSLLLIRWVAINLTTNDEDDFQNNDNERL